MIQDVPTKYVVAYSISNKVAKTKAEILVDQLILKYGIFKTLNSRYRYTKKFSTTIKKEHNI